MKRLFINTSNDIVEFMFISEKEIEEIKKEFESVYDYLSTHTWDNWVEMTVSQKNEKKILDMVVEMHKELQPLREGANAI